MSFQYDQYLANHRANVKRGFDWLCENLSDVTNDISDAAWQIEFAHDKSKDEEDEYNAYDAYFYGNNRSYKVVQDYQKAWLTHIHILGNDTESNDHGYKLHLTWGCLASPSEKQNSSVNESPEPLAMSWEYSATPVKVTAAVKGKKLKATATMTFDSTKVDATKLQKLEGILYGTDSSGSTEPRLPMPDEIISMMTTEG